MSTVVADKYMTLTATVRQQLPRNSETCNGMTAAEEKVKYLTAAI